MFVSDRLNILTFQKLLGGCKDISIQIIQEKNKLELEDRKQEVIERDFYNWLNYDLPTRNFLGSLIIEYQSKSENDKTDFLLNNIEFKQYNREYVTDYFNYYDKLKEKLGLNSLFERKDKTHLLFQRQWWKTTEKNSLPWKHNHLIIECKCKIKVYKYRFRYFHTQATLEVMFHESPNMFRNATFKERYNVYSEVYGWRNRPSIIFIDGDQMILV
jgi:hypothetical protein